MVVQIWKLHPWRADGLTVQPLLLQFTAVRRAQVTFIMKHTGVDTKEGRPSRRNIRVSLPEMNPPELCKLVLVPSILIKTEVSSS